MVMSRFVHLKSKLNPFNYLTLVGHHDGETSLNPGVALIVGSPFGSSPSVMGMVTPWPFSALS